MNKRAVTIRPGTVLVCECMNAGFREDLLSDTRCIAATRPHGLYTSTIVSFRHTRVKREDFFRQGSGSFGVQVVRVRRKRLK